VNRTGIKLTAGQALLFYIVTLVKGPAPAAIAA